MVALLLCHTQCNYNTFFFQKTTTLSSFKSNLKTFLFSFFYTPQSINSDTVWRRFSGIIHHYPSMSIPTFLLQKLQLCWTMFTTPHSALHMYTSQLIWRLKAVQGSPRPHTYSVIMLDTSQTGAKVVHRKRSEITVTSQMHGYPYYYYCTSKHPAPFST